jgi:hypothetical protein
MYMPKYRIFGGLLDSDVVLNGLSAVDTGATTWRFRRTVGQAAVSDDDAMLLGAEVVSPELTITLSRASGGTLRLHYSAYGLGTFLISRDGTTIEWAPGANPRNDALRWVLLGRVMAMAMYQTGTLCLHGSAIAWQGRALCFLAPKRHGKSTLAAALVSAGARLISDDVVPIELGPPVGLRPGPPVLRLHEDSEAAVDMPAAGARRVGDDVGKTRLDLIAPQLFAEDVHPLDAIYLLQPVGSDATSGRSAVREPVEGLHALQRLVPQASVASLLSPAESSLLLTHAAAIVRTVPIYELRFARDLNRLPDVVRELATWHSAPRGDG